MDLILYKESLRHAKINEKKKRCLKSKIKGVSFLAATKIVATFARIAMILSKLTLKNTKKM